MKMCVVHLVLTCWYPAAGLQKWGRTPDAHSAKTCCIKKKRGDEKCTRHRVTTEEIDADKK